MAVRPYHESDRDQALALLGGSRAIDSPAHHVWVADAGPQAGLALWVAPAPGEEEGHLGPVIVPRGAPARLMYELALACIRDAQARNVRHGYLTVKDPRLLALIQRDTQFHAQPCGWHPVTGKPIEWEIHSTVDNAIAELERVLSRGAARRAQ